MRRNQWYAKTKAEAKQLVQLKGGEAMNNIYKMKCGRHKGQYFVGSHLEYLSFT